MISKAGDYEISEILYHHIDQIDANLEILKSIVDASSKFSEALKTKQGGSLVTFLTQYEAAISSFKTNYPKMDANVQNFPKDHMINLEMSVIIIDDIINWMHVARAQLLAIGNHSQEFDLQWNNELSIQVCTIFVMLTKICLFFHFFPNCRIIILMINHYDKLKQLKLTLPYKDLLQMITRITVNPFSYLNENLKPLSHKFSSLISSIGTFLLRALGSWPIVNWKDFMILERSQQIVESTLPSLSRLVLMNMPTIFETVLFFAFVFPRIVTKHSQFYSLMENVFSDCPFTYITRTYKISINQLYDTFKLMSTNGNQKLTLPISLFANIRQSGEIKDQISHIQRMKYIYLIVKDIVEISTYDISYLPRFIYDIFPLAGFAAYEIKTGLTKEVVNKEIAQLLSLMVELAQLILKNQDFISRFFLYNLATVDLKYLEQIQKNYSGGGEEWLTNIVNQFKTISESLSTLDLEAFDKGDRYDATPLIVTMGRCFYHFNNIKLTEKASYLHPAFEHLTTILFHLKLMNNPLKTFLEICPLHTFWSFRSVLFKYSNEFPGGISNYASFISLISFFNLDRVVLTLDELEERNNSSFLTQSRDRLLDSIKKEITQFLDPSNRLLNIISQNRFQNQFSYKLFHLYSNKIPTQAELNLKSKKNSTEAVSNPDQKKVSVQDILISRLKENANHLERVLQIKELMKKLPSYVSTGTAEMAVTSFIAKNLTDQVSSIIISPDATSVPPGWMDAAFSASTQLLWPIFALLNTSYPRKLMESRIANSKTDNLGVKYISLISAIKNPSPPPKITNNSKFIDKFIDRLSGFIHTDYRKTIYRTHGRCFDNITTVASVSKDQGGNLIQSHELKYLGLSDGDLSNAKLNYQACQFFSEEGFRYLVTNLGLHAGFSADCVIINEAVLSMEKIYNIYTKIPELNKWFSTTSSPTTSPDASVSVLNHSLGEAQNNKDVAEAAQELIHLGVILTLRNLLRRAMSESFDMSMPGAIQVLQAAFLRSGNHISQREDFIKEMVTTWTNINFIKEILNNRFDTRKIKKESDPMKFFCFLSLLLNSMFFDDVKFIPDNEMITKNLHLAPVAVEAFINVLDVFCNSTSKSVVTSGMNVFFSTLQKIVAKKSGESSINQKKAKAIKDSINSLIILGDLFPKIVKSVEYGRIGQCFPYSIVTEAYRETESEYEESKVANLTRKKKRRFTIKF